MRRRRLVMSPPPHCSLLGSLSPSHFLFLFPVLSPHSHWTVSLHLLSLRMLLCQCFGLLPIFHKHKHTTRSTQLSNCDEAERLFGDDVDTVGFFWKDFFSVFALLKFYNCFFSSSSSPCSLLRVVLPYATRHVNEWKRVEIHWITNFHCTNTTVRMVCASVCASEYVGVATKDGRARVSRKEWFLAKLETSCASIKLY